MKHNLFVIYADLPRRFDTIFIKNFNSISKNKTVNSLRSGKKNRKLNMPRRQAEFVCIRALPICQNKQIIHVTSNLNLKIGEEYYVYDRAAHFRQDLFLSGEKLLFIESN